MKKSIILIILVVLIMSMGATYAQDVLATQKGPSQAEKGQNITIIYTITNNGNQNIFMLLWQIKIFINFLEQLNPVLKRFSQKKFIFPQIMN